MRVPLAWLREFIDLPEDAQAIADRLAMLGFPVAEIEKRPSLSGVVVGKIVELEKHPNADRLQVARVDVGRDALLTIATAATNVAQGQTIPVALVGARLAHLTIEPRKMRGIASEGMMISADEVALASEWFEDGIVQIEPNVPLGTDAIEYFGLELEVLDVEITSNRVDVMSMIGIARELAASYGTALRLPSFENPGTTDDPDGKKPDVLIESPDCRRFVAQRFDNVTVGTAPTWMRVRLALAGQRPINNLVDVSNYVMLETGQPLHFYDAAHVAQSRLIVRDAREGEKLITLDDTERTLTVQALVIADPEHALGIAGVMGGASSEVTYATNSLILESANFNGARVRRTSMQLGLRSEASSRHEKTLPPAFADIGAARAAQLLIALGATAYRPHEFGAKVEVFPAIQLQIRDVPRLLGIQLETPQIANHLSALGCTIEAQGNSAIAVTPPFWRQDLTIAADLVEEVARMEGYDNIIAVAPSVPAHEVSSAAFDAESTLAHALVQLGYREIITPSLNGTQPFDRERRAGLVSEYQAVEVLNPLSEEQRFLRIGLEANLIGYFANAHEPVRVFEIGHVFHRHEERIIESAVVTFGFSEETIDEPAWHDSQFLRLKGDAETLIRVVTGHKARAVRAEYTGFHSGKTASLMVDDNRVVATIGRVDPRLAHAYELSRPAYICTIDIGLLPQYVVPHYAPPSRFPSTYRDLALTVRLEITSAEIEQTVLHALGAIGTSVHVFDEYRGPQVGEGRKSIAVRVTMQRFDATITDEEVDAAIADVLEALRSERGAVIRE